MPDNDDCTVNNCVQGCCNYYGNCPDNSTSDYSNRCWKYYEKNNCNKQSALVGDSDGDQSDDCKAGSAGTGALVGAIIGGVVGLIVIVVVAIFLWKKCKKRNNSASLHNANQNMSNTLQNNSQNYYHPYPPVQNNLADQQKTGTDVDFGANVSNQPYVYPGLKAPVK